MRPDPAFRAAKEGMPECCLQLADLRIACDDIRLRQIQQFIIREIQRHGVTFAALNQSIGTAIAAHI
jgi:hypothetical protein